jgi:DNA-binding NarL/FixJ family response regulator
VIIAEDSYLVREGVRQLLEATGEVDVVASVGDASALLSLVEELQPDAVLTDIRMPPDHGTEGIAAAKVIRRAYPTTGVVVLSQHADEGYVVELISEGAEGLGYLLKERVGDREQLTNALRETSRGGSVIDPTLVDALMRRRHLDKRSKLDVLTARELAVLREMAGGSSNAAIGQALSLSQSSIEKHVNAIFSKLSLAEEPRLHRRVAAVVTYLREVNP